MMVGMLIACGTKAIKWSKLVIWVATTLLESTLVKKLLSFPGAFSSFATWSSGNFGLLVAIIFSATSVFSFKCRFKDTFAAICLTESDVLTGLSVIVAASETNTVVPSAIYIAWLPSILLIFAGIPVSSALYNEKLSKNNIK